MLFSYLFTFSILQNLLKANVVDSVLVIPIFCIPTWYPLYMQIFVLFVLIRL